MHQPAAARPVVARAALIVVMAIALAACTTTKTPSPTPTQAPSPTPTQIPSPTPSPIASPTPVTAEIVLERAPANLGCDTIGVEYRSVTFRIDPAASPQVWAEANTGTRLAVRWDASFTGGTAGNPVVTDRAGVVVAEDGDVLAIPDGAWPDLHGHFVCPSPDALYVLDRAPA